MNNQASQALVGLRAAVGAGAWLAPNFSGKLFGLDPEGNPQASYLARLFGIRDIALGFGLNSASGPERARWLQLGIVCDLADAAAGVLAGRNGSLPKRASLLVTATALAAAAMGIASLQGEQPPS
jgi:hypothetical protein